MLPQSSVAVKVTEAAPELPQPLLNSEKLLDRSEERRVGKEC